MARIAFCNMCGKQLDFWDRQENFSIYSRLGYGSRFDECDLELDLCCGCMDTLIMSCKISPVMMDVDEEECGTDE